MGISVGTPMELKNSREKLTLTNSIEQENVSYTMIKITVLTERGAISFMK